MHGPPADYAPCAAVYDERPTGVPGDVAFYVARALEADAPVVELGVGTGRIALPVAEAGVSVIGIDTSDAMLRLAASKARCARLASRLRLVRGDMRAFSLRRPVTLVTIPFRTFLHNVTRRDQLRTLAAARDALVPGGRLAFNVFNPGALTVAEGVRHAGAVPPRGGPWVQPARTGRVVRTTRTFRRPGGGRIHCVFMLRYVYRREMERLLARAGFVVEALYGDHFGAPFDEASSEMVWIARRA